MSSFKDTFKSKLTWYLAGCVLLSGMIAGVIGYVFYYFGTDYVEDVFDDQEVNKTWQIRYLEDLQEYINDNEISAANIAELKNWTEKNSYVYLSVYKDQQIIFNSDYAYVVPLTEMYTLEDAQNATEEDADEAESDDAGSEGQENFGEFESDETDYLYKLFLADGSVARADIFCYDYWKYQYYVSALALMLGIFLFVIILTRLINRKIRYINNIAKELQILEGGNLEYPITIKGKDELANLAQGIEQMRLSIIDNMKKEYQMMQGNKELVTSMSHDLRTPLTTLTGYLEILTMGNVTDEEKRRHYLELSLAKSQEIKQLSDDLFEYFLIYGENEKKLEVEPVPAAMLVEDLIHNQFLGLEEEGYEIAGINNVSEEAGNCMINVKYMQRVMNNLISNLGKYADKDEPIEVSANMEQQYMVLKIRNKIRTNLEPHESTKIGLITCERIMRLHHGEFQKFESEGDFVVKLVIPME
ncbi:MAG: HAMP domain-containing sensor histidine kinase [Clostridiales bacterium]|nr:HAMP domain-containing sensor histidine kinase [Clostridiales bacterium]